MGPGSLTVSIPNPHQGDVSRKLLSDILRKAEITRQQWEQL
jgi:hypothetical protein